MGLTASLFEPLWSGLYDGNNVPLSGGQVFIYNAGTNTLAVNIYYDGYGTSQAANPVTLDANGRATIFGSGAYKLIVKDYLGNIITYPALDNYIVQAVTPASVPVFADSVINSGGTVTLVNDNLSPGNIYYYGTNSSGVKGFFILPTFTASLTLANNTVTLSGDNATPGNAVYYGTNYAGTKGFYTLPPLGQVYLSLSGGNLLLAPYQGNAVTIAGAAYSVPSAGVTLAPTSLSPGTTYYIYIYNNGGTLTLEASTTGHSTDSTAGNIGVEIETGDNTRTLVGRAQCITGPAWGTGLQVISWFNRHNLSIQNNFSTDRSTTSSSYTEIDSEIRIPFLTWGDESVFGSINGGSILTVDANMATGLAIDNTTTPQSGIEYASLVTTALSIYPFPIAVYGLMSLAEGYHYATLVGAVSAGTMTWCATTSLSGNGKSKVLLNIGIRG